MSIISRITTWTIGQVLKAADLNGEFNNITNLLNNLDAATTSWTNVKVGTLNVTAKATVPNGASATDAAAFGQIFNGFQAPVQFVDSTNKTTSSSTFQSTALTATITPTIASHRIRITISGFFSVDSVAATTVRSTILRGATNLAGGSAGFAQSSGPASGTGGLVMMSYSYIDSPATTSATVYTMQILSTDNTNNVEYSPGTNAKSIIILEEIV